MTERRGPRGGRCSHGAAALVLAALVLLAGGPAGVRGDAHSAGDLEAARALEAASDTPSPSQTATASPSQTGSASASATGTGSVSQSGTSSASQTGSASASATGTPSASVTSAPTSSDTGTVSPPPTGSPTASLTKSSRPSLTSTRTPPATATGTPSATATGTPPPTPSATPPETPSQTGTPTPSLSPGASPSGTPPETPSASDTATPPVTPSGTGTPSQSQTGTPSTSLSRTPARSFTSSVTAAATVSPTPPGTPSLTGSLTPGGTSSGTATASPSASNTPATIPDAAVVFGMALPGASCTDFAAFPELGGALRCALSLALPLPLALVRLDGVTCANGTVIRFAADADVNTAVAPACAGDSGGRRRLAAPEHAAAIAAAPLVAVSSLAQLGPGRALVYRASSSASDGDRRRRRRLDATTTSTSADMTLVVPPPPGTTSYADATDAQQSTAGGLTSSLADMQSVGAPGDSSPLGDALSASGFLDAFAATTGTNPAGLADGVQLSDPVVEVPSPTMTSTSSPTQTPSQTQTGTPSPSHTGTPSPSGTGTETRRFSDSGSASRTASATGTGTPTPTGTPSQTASPTPSRTPRAPFACGSVVVAVVGDGSSGAGANTAHPVWLFERTREGGRVQDFPLRATTAGGGGGGGDGGAPPACTLGVASPGGGAGDDLWRYDTDGLPSRSADGTVVVLPCFDIAAGDAMSMTTDKTIAVVGSSGTPTYVRVDATTYYGSFTPTGFLQAAALDGGASGFWLAGMSISQWGFRYLPPGALTTVPILGDSDGQPGYSDARGIAIFDGKLYGSTNDADGASLAGVFQIGAAGAPTSATSTWTALPGVATPWTFAFESASSLWASMNAVGYAAGTLVHYVLSGGGSWSVERTVQLDGSRPLYSVNGRWEDLTGANTGLSWVVYASSPATAYRYVPATNATTIVLDLAAVYADVSETAIRGVVPAPQAAGACSPTPTATSTPTPSSTATGTPSSSQTASNTGTPSQTQTGTPSASQTASNTGTSTPTQTGTPSASQTASNTGTPSSSNTGTPSETATATSTSSMTSTRSRRSSTTSTQSETPTPTASSTGTASQSQTGTPSASETPSATPSDTNTGTATQSQTGTPSSSHTGTSSQTQTGTPSSSHTGTPSHTQTGTPSASNTGTPSHTQTGTPSASNTGTASQTQTGTPSHSQTGTQTPTSTPTRTRRGSASGSASQTTTGTGSITPSPTGTRTGTASPTATRTPASAFACGSVLVTVVGDGSSGGGANTARGVTVQERTREGALLQSIPLRTTSAGGGAAPACTLGVTVAGTTSLWRYDTDGLPSLSADGAVVAVPCFDIPAGSTMTMESGKTVAVIGAGGLVTYVPLAASAYFSTFDVSGFFQAATLDGTAFWTAGMSAANSGFLYLPPASSTATRVLGGVNQPGYFDARGVAIYDGKLYGASTSAGNAAFAGVFQIGAAGLPTAATSTWTMLPGVKQPWAIVFEGATSLWVSVDHADYPAGTVVHYAYNAGTTTWDAVDSVRLHTSPLYSLTGRWEDLTGANTGLSFVLYASSPAKAYRYVPATNATTIVLDLAAVYADVSETAIRGVVPAPQAAGACSPTPTTTSTPTPSSTATGTPSQTQTGTPSQTQTGTPSSTQTGTPSSSPTASNTGTSTPTQTGTPSSTSTGTPSSSNTGTPSQTQTGTPSASQTTTGTPTSSQTQTGTPSSTGTGTPSASNTGTPSHTQTGTPSASQTQTSTPSSSQTASRTGTPSQTQTGTPSPSQTASVTAVATITPTVTPSHTPASVFTCSSILTVVVGDGSSGAGANTARTVTVQERTREGALLQSIPLRTWSTPSAPACTLGATTGGVADWVYETDGLPSLSTDGTVVALPCFDIPVGGAMSMEARKTVVTVGAGGAITYVPFAADTYGGVVNNAGVRQAATVDGTSFYLSGVGANNWGVRYLPPGSTTTTTILGMNDGEPTYYDARGVVVYGGNLYGATSDADGGANAGVFQIGAGLPTVETPAWTKLEGVGVPWTFVFESPSALWAASSDAGRPPCTLVRYARSATNATWAAVASVRTHPGCTALYSLSGRWEDLTGANAGLSFVLYAANATTVWRHVPSTAATTAIVNLASEYAGISQTALRGVVPAPQAAGACSPTPTATSTPTPSSTATGTPSQTQTGTPSQTQTGTPSPSRTQTGTPSASQTGTPSLTQTGTASETQTGTPSASRTGTASQTQTGTASSTQTGTPSASHTGTASQTQTGTASSTQTGTPSASHTGTASQTQTGTPSQTQTGTPSPSRTRTGTPSASQTGTASSTQTGTPSPSPTRTPSASNTRTPSASQTGTPSLTQTGTASETQTGTPSASRTGTASQTQTGTPSQTQTGTPSPSRTRTVTPSASQTGTASSTQTGTASQTQTGTPSQTQTGTPSQTQTGTPSPSRTGTQSGTQTGTPSSTRTGTPSRSQTGTSSASQTRTPSASATRTASASQTRTASSSQTRTPSASQTRTSSASQTRTASSSQTRTPSASATGTASASVTRTASASQTRTPSQTQTGTSSASATRTPSASQTRTPSSSQTRTPSQTQTGTPSASQTGTPSQTQTGTPSPTGTGTASPSNTGTPSQTQTGTPSRAASQTGTPSGSQTGTGSASQTGTASPSRTATASSSQTATPSTSQTASATGTASQSLPPTVSSTASLTPSASATATSTPSSSGTRTPSASQSATASLSGSKTAAASVTGSVSRTPAETSTATGTLSTSSSGSVSASGSASASRTASASVTPSVTPTDTPQSRSASATRTPASATATPTRSGVFPAWADTVATLRVGDVAQPASLTGGRALPVYVDVYRTRPTVARILSVPLPTAGYTDPATGTYVGACTLATGAAVGRWNFDREGFPSNSADGAVIIIPCYDVPVGSAIGGTSRKTIAVVDRSYAVNTSFTGAIAMGVKSGTPTPNNGWRQIASPDGVSFWTSSVAAADSGYRYIARPMRKSADGAFASVAIFPKTTATYKAGANDARGIAIYGGKLYATAGSGDSGFDRVFAIGYSTPPVAPTDFYDMQTTQLYNPWTFVFTSPLSLWVAVDRGAGTPGGRGVVRFWNRALASADFSLRHTVVFSASVPVYSIAGRVEFERSVIYGVTATALLRYDSAGVAAGVTTAVQLTAAASSTVLRGVMFPGAPLFSPSRSASPSPKSRAPTPSRTRMATPTRSRSGKKLRRA